MDKGVVAAMQIPRERKSAMRLEKFNHFLERIWEFSIIWVSGLIFFFSYSAILDPNLTNPMAYVLLYCIILMFIIFLSKIVKPVFNVLLFASIPAVVLFMIFH